MRSSIERITLEAHRPGRDRLVRQPPGFLDGFEIEPAVAKIEQFLDTSAFEMPPERVFGNAPVRLGSGPAGTGIDLSIHKNWMFGDRYTLRLRAEFFNLPNVPNFGEPASVRGRPDFGRLQSARQGRHIQFGLQFRF